MELERKLENVENILREQCALMIFLEGDTDRIFFERFLLPNLKEEGVSDVKCESMDGVDKVDGRFLEMISRSQPRAPVLFILDNDKAGRDAKIRIDKKIVSMEEKQRKGGNNVNIRAIVLPETDAHKKFRKKYGLKEEISSFTIEYYFDMRKLYSVVRKCVRDNGLLGEMVKDIYLKRGNCTKRKELVNIPEDNVEEFLYARQLPDEIKRRVHEEMSRKEEPIQAEAVRRLVGEILSKIAT